MEYNWDDGRLFLEVARQGQMKKAAIKLGLTPVTLTRRIAAFEARTGAPLFIRRAGGVDLSQEGQRIFEALERAEAEMLKVSEKISDTQHVSGTVRLALPDGFMHGFVLQNIAKFTRAHPDLTLELVPLPRHFSLSKREADIAVFVGKPQGMQIWHAPLIDYKLGLYASRDYIETYSAPQTTEDLEAHNLVGFVPDLLPQHSLDYAKEAYNKWHSKIAIPSAISQLEAVKAGAGIGMLHSYLSDTSHLVRILPHIEINRTYYCATHTNIRLQPRIKCVLDFLKMSAVNK